MFLIKTLLHTSLISIFFARNILMTTYINTDRHQILAGRRGRPTAAQEAMVNLHHTHHPLPNRCSSLVVQTIDAPLHLVWSVVRRFDRPQSYKRFVRGCKLWGGGGGVGTVREVDIVSGLPAETSVERLDRLDDDSHVMGFSVIGGDHRLANYHSTLTLHEEEEEEEEEEDGVGVGVGVGVRVRVKKTVAMESYAVDVPDGNSEEETCLFVNTIIEFNLRTLAAVAEGTTATTTITTHHG